MSSENEELPLEIDCFELKRLLDSDQEVLLVDCRRPEEFEFNRIEGAIHIPMNETPDRIGEIEPYRGKPIVIQCHHGIRSLRVAHFLRDQGFTTAHSLHGGIDAWSQQIDPSVPTY